MGLMVGEAVVGITGIVGDVDGVKVEDITDV